MNTIGKRISVTWNNRCEVAKLSIIFAGNIAFGLSWIQLF